jgi:hypothetical protein
MDSKTMMKIVMEILPVVVTSKEKVRRRDSAMTGTIYYQELIDSNSADRFIECARMDKRTFTKLLDTLCALNNCFI